MILQGGAAANRAATMINQCVIVPMKTRISRPRERCLAELASGCSPLSPCQHNRQDMQLTTRRLGNRLICDSLEGRLYFSLLLAITLILGLCAQARANDSSAELAAGGLVLTKNDAIELRSEDLYLSTEAVRVIYRFVNTAPQDVAVTVAFPMPDISMENPFTDNLSIPTDSETNFLGFRTLVDGQPVTAQLEQKVIKHGQDQTALMHGLGIPLAPHLPATAQALDRLPPAAQDQLLRLGLAVNDDYDAGKGMEHHLAAAWTLKSTYYWTQTFPAGREVTVEHAYQPAVGVSVGTLWGTREWPQDPEYPAERRHYCVDDAFVAAVERARRPGDFAPPFHEKRLEYILTTGANWKGPIKDFRLVVDKGAPANLVSFCGEGVRKIGPTTFEVRYRDYTPQRDLSVLILVRHPR